MSRLTEKVFREFEKYIEGEKFNSQEEYEEELKQFLQMTNNNEIAFEDDAWDYLDMAYDADTVEEALKYARKALRLDNNCLDADILIADLTASDDEDLKAKYERLIRKGEKYLNSENLFNEENIGQFWSILETRPYMRLKYSYIKILIMLGKMKKAVKECEDLLRLSKNDNLGVRYILICLYAFFEDEANALRIYKEYGKELSAHMLLPLIALYYKLDDYKKAEKYLKKLDETNSELRDVFGETEFLISKSKMEEIVESGAYRPCSKEDIIIAFAENLFLYESVKGFPAWIGKTLYK
ncbi:MAG: hypothetical protein GX076_06705 [Clostridiales bacterium]|nr:hypothetical protein [Clostridiales bacterium]